MLRGIPTEISPDLLKILAEMGHGDRIAIVDDFYGAVSHTPSERVVYAKGNDLSTMVEAILKIFPLDTEFSDEPVLCMVPDGESREALQSQAVSQAVLRVLKEADCPEEKVGAVERTPYYDLAKQAYATISTSEQQPYGCLLLQKGVF